MKINFNRFRRAAVLCAYIYLALPLIIFFLGWCRWYISIPATAVTVVSLVFCMREHTKNAGKENLFCEVDMLKLIGIVMFIAVWVILSGVGGFVWQNSDHWWRNEIFELMVEQEWPMHSIVDAGGVIEERGLVYYIGFWLLPSLFGKLFGISAGYVAQYLWAVVGILIAYALICIWRRKISVWPLVLFAFFSGLDIIGMQISRGEPVGIFDVMHIEAWSWHYQFSSITTQLFWVFNQAIPIWIAAMLIFFGERPKNIVFTVSLTVLTSTFPFVGLLPFALYFMIVRSTWDKNMKKTGQLLKNGVENWASVQNIVGGGAVSIISGVYVFGNNALHRTLDFLTSETGVILLLALCVLGAAVFWGATTLVLKGWGKYMRCTLVMLGGVALVMGVKSFHYSEWQSTVFFWMNLSIFYFLEAGVFLVCLYPMLQDKKLFWLNAVWLYIVPFIRIGSSCDFCMRASIPGLLLILLWSIYVIDQWLGKREWRVFALIALLLVGAVTPLHEIKRTYVNTTNYYENTSVSKEEIYLGANFSGSTDGFFWKYIAKDIAK